MGRGANIIDRKVYNLFISHFHFPIFPRHAAENISMLNTFFFCYVICYGLTELPILYFGYTILWLTEFPTTVF